MDLFCITCVIFTVLKVILADESNIIDYFKSDTFRTVQNHWQIERKSFENALALILQQDYGYGGMNVYVRSMTDPYKISDGFYFSDNVVDFSYLSCSLEDFPYFYGQTFYSELGFILKKDMLELIQLILLETRLHSLPIMIDPQVMFALASNYLHIEAELGRMIINTNYVLIRNQSDIVFTASDQDNSKKSPFSFQQVQDSGELTIIAQDCNLVGYTITSFSANTVNLGLDTFKVTNCKFTVEIYSLGAGSPPVFRPYFSEDQSLALETMLSIPIRAELMPKLQAAVFTYVNTSAIFGDKLPQLRVKQNSVFKKTSNYMSGIVGKFVQNTIKKTQGILQLKPLEFTWNKTCSDGICGNCIRLKEVILYGLDTAYSAHIGGPFRLQSTKVAEAIRFSTMQVRGKLYFENATVNGEHDFAVELQDVAVNIEMEAKSNSFVLVPTKVYVTGWRNLDFSILELHVLDHERQAAQSLITGYLVNQIPVYLLDHISKTFGADQNRNEPLADYTDKDKAVDDPSSREPNKNEKQKQVANDEGIKNNNDSDSSDDKGENKSDREQQYVENETENVIHSINHPSENEIQ